jgi:hypothetical protein
MIFRRCWDEFVEEWREREVQRQRRVEERSRRCREYEWWDPRGWVCWIVTVVRYVWEWVTETFLDILNITVCVICEVLTFLDYLVLGHRIFDTAFERQVPSINPGGAKAVASAFNNAVVTTRVDYTDSGKGFEFTFVEGIVGYTNLDGTGVFTPLKRDNDDVPQSISYSGERNPGTHPAPAFDLIAAGGGRILAKEAGWPRFYFSTIEDEFLHFIPPDSPGWLSEDFGSHNQAVPGFYSKLDPQYNTGASSDTLSWWSRQDYNEHPSLTPFSLPWGGSSLKFARDLGILPDVMMVRVEPRVWHLIDDRPPFGSGEPPPWVHLHPSSGTGFLRANSHADLDRDSRRS